MAFRVGILFQTPPDESTTIRPVLSFLEEIEKRTEAVRGTEPLTIVPFVRTKNEAVALANDPVCAKYSVEAATWDEPGTVFRSIQTLANSTQHLPREPRLDFDRGMQALLSLSCVVVAVCASEQDMDELADWIPPFQNAAALLALVSLQHEAPRFFEIGPRIDRIDHADWFALKLIPRWSAPKPSLQSLPPSRTAILGMLFPWLASAIIKRRFENVKKRPRSEIDSCRAGMGISTAAVSKLCQADQNLLEEHLKQLCPFFFRHDDLGRYYSNVFRTTCLLVPLLIAASTVLAVAGVIDPVRRDPWHVVEGVFLVIAAWLVLRSKVKGHHAKWVEHRLTAELMRSALVCSLLHTIPRTSSPHEEPRRWEQQTELLWTYLRALPALSFTTPEADLLSARRSAVADYATNQEQFHMDFAEQHYRAQKWLVKISGRAFFTTLCLAVAQLVIAHLDEPHEELALKLMMATLICAAGAFAISLLAHQLGFEAIAERSTNAAHHFRLLRTAMDQAPYTADARRVYASAQECAQFILAEQHSWYRHIPLLRLDL